MRTVQICAGIPSTYLNVDTEMSTAAAATKPATTGRIPANINCTGRAALYFSHMRLTTLTQSSDGSTTAKEAARAPGIPAVRKPTKVAELMAMGPGVTSAIPTTSTN